MKKIILLFTCIFYISTSEGQQCWNTINTATTDWDNPNSNNTWNWTLTPFTNVYIVDPNAGPADPSLPASIQSPFFNPSSGPYHNVNLTPFIDAYSNKGFDGLDFKPEDGWELLAKDFGVCCLQSTAVNDPFFALYNRSTGIIRVFLLQVYQTTTAFNGATVMLSFDHNGLTRESALLTHAYPICKAVVDFPKGVVMQNPNYFVNDPYFWFYADFPAAYDPCTCNYFSKIKVSFKFIQTADIKLEGEITGTIRQVVDPTSNVLTTDGVKTITDVASQVGSAFKAVNKSYSTWDGFKKDADKFIDNNNSALKLNMTTQLTKLKGFTKYLPYIGELVGIFDFLSGGGKSTAAQKQPTPLAFETHQKLTLNGTLTTTVPTSDIVFWTPGSNPTALTGKPVYDNILGVFNILEKPVIKYVDYKINNPNLTSEPDIRQYKLNSPLKYSVNPAAKVRIKKIEAAYIIRFREFTLNPVPPNYVPYLEILGMSLGSIAGQFPHPVEFGEPSTTYMNLSVQDRMKRAGFEFEQFPKTYPNNDQDYVILRTPYVPITCFNEQTFFLYHPQATTNPFEKIYIKLLITMERTDNPNAQDVFFVYTYEPTFQFFNFGSYDVMQDFLVPASYPLIDPFYPTNLRANPNAPIGPVMPYSPWIDVPFDLKFENTTITTNQTAINTITIGENVIINNGITIKAGKNIDINPANIINPTVNFLIGYDQPSCNNSPTLNHNTNSEITSFCALSGAYDVHSARNAVPSRFKDDIIPFDIKIYPNPSKGFLKLQPSNDNEEYTLKVYNNMGVLLLEKQAISTSNLNLSNFSKGIYFIKITTAKNGTLNKKIVLN